VSVLAFLLLPPESASRASAVYVVLCLLAALLFSASPPVRAAQPQYGIEIDAPEAIRKLLESHLEIVRWREHERMTDAEFLRLYGNARREIEALLETEGHYRPRLDLRLEGAEGERRAVFRVDPGESVRVASVEIRITGVLAGESAAAEREKLDLPGRWQLPAGRVFRHADWESAKRNLVERLALERFPRAAIAQSEAVVNAAAGTVAVRVVVDSGPVVRFGPLVIEGLKRYPRSIVENLSHVRAGSDYSYFRLQEFQTRLTDSGYFTSVTVDAVPDEQGVAPVRVVVDEREPRRIALGLGYSTDTGARVQGEWRQLDFLGRGWQFTTRLKLESRASSARADVHFPTDAEGYQDRLMADAARDDVQGLDTRKVVLTAGRARRRGDIETDVSVAYVQEEEKLAGGVRDNQYAFTANFAWTLRRVNHPFYPTGGYALNLQVGGAPGLIVAEQSFLRTYAKAVRYLRVGEEGVVTLRGELGAVLSRGTDDVPSDYLFRAGGDNSVRGFAFQSLGIPRAGAVTGGRALAVMSAEYTRWVTSDWGYAVFYDAGNARDEFRGFRFAQGYGFGARWRSPVGPLNLDLAHGRGERGMRLHFSVGLAF